MKNHIAEIFGTHKPIIGMLHLKGENDKEILERVDTELHLMLDNKVDCVLVENYFGTPLQAEQALKYISKKYPDICYGINLLHDDALAFELALKYHAKFIQLDSVAGHLEKEEDKRFQEFIEKAREKCKAFVLGGVRFKYQPYKSGRRLDEDLAIGMKRCDAIVVTGDATGQETNLEKINSFRRITGDFPLFVGAGMTPENAGEQLAIADGAVVGSYFKDTLKDTGDVCADHIKTFMTAVDLVRKDCRQTAGGGKIKKPLQYTTYKEELYAGQGKSVKEFCKETGLMGTEVFMDDIVSRDKVLFTDDKDKKQLLDKLAQLQVKRVHCSYWAYPTSFLTKNNFKELTERFGGLKEVEAYYGDLTGTHMFERWAMEYEAACGLGAQSYTFHLIDYAPIDGRWDFTLSRQDICQAMIYMIQNLLSVLTEKGLLTPGSPTIEVENAGWGLEYGLQTAEDFEEMFRQLYDPMDKVRIGWDLNHLLHAIGFNEKDQRAEFFLTEQEITPEMERLEQDFGNTQQLFAEKWLEKNLLARSTAGKIGSLHVSDCKMKHTAYFKNGRLIGPYYEEIQSLETWEEMEEYGVKIVLDKYDSHEILSEGILSGVILRRLLQKIQAVNPEVVLLHELKNSKNQLCAVNKQLAELGI